MFTTHAQPSHSQRLLLGSPTQLQSDLVIIVISCAVRVYSIATWTDYVPCVNVFCTESMCLCHPGCFAYFLRENVIIIN